MNTRLKRFVSFLKSKSCAGYLITNSTNIRYLTCFPAADAWLFVTLAKTYYITDARYTLEAKQGIRGVCVSDHQGSMVKKVIELARAHHVKIAGYDDRHLTCAQFKALQRVSRPYVKWVNINHLVEQLREIKDDQELRSIKRALNVHQEALNYLKRVIKPGKTEEDVYLALDRFVKSRKVSFSFSPIIASGPNSCYPHAKITARKIRLNEPVLVDMGIEVDGYKSDLTRMFYLGTIPKLVAQTHKIVQEAQLKAIEIIRDGVKVADLDRAARQHLQRHDLAKYFNHSLGHGVGLDIHESPRLSVKSNEVLRAGMVITIEPAVYIPNKFGIRVEEMVLVKQSRGDVLSGNIY